MVRLLTAIAVSGIVALPLPASDSQASRAPASAQELLDRYASGDYKAVDAALSGPSSDLPPLYEGLQRVASIWVNAGGAAAVPRRRLIAASVALEATGARLEEWGTCSARRNAPLLLDGRRVADVIKNEDDHWDRFHISLSTNLQLEIATGGREFRCRLCAVRTTQPDGLGLR
jgi:hypothetical protein